ncbi:MAG TPA: hypothetical protein VHX62_02910 [Solirubrobacteraceae bacterium]|nr:hypothetical protein [Solirubrobacteraceae bacterium]
MITSTTLTEPAYAGPAADSPRRSGLPRAWWLLVALGVIGAAVALVAISRMRPDYDGFGWLVWGRQVLHWNLNTDGAPSWKPLTFIFTLPYALAGDTQVWLWTVTAVAGAVGGCVFAARIAFRLTGPAPGRRYAPYIAAVFAGVCLLGIDTYAHLVTIANSDPLIVTLCLGAIDCHLSRRRRLAFVLLVGAALGRPEAWPFALGYAVWGWRAVPGMRLLAVLGVALIPAFWFTIPALTSHSWFISGDLALNQKTIIHGSKILGVISRFRGLYELPMQLAALVGVGLAVWRRDRVTLAIAAAGALWVIVEIAFAYHGWSAVNRYLIEPAAVMVVIAGGAVGRLLTLDGPRLVRWAGPVAVVVLAVALVPTARSRARDTRAAIETAQVHGRQIDRLTTVIKRIGGPDKVKSCGQPTSLLGYQSTVAWAVGLNVGDVGYRPGVAIGGGEPIVLFKPHEYGWQVRVYNTSAPQAARCHALRTDSPMG